MKIVARSKVSEGMTGTMDTLRKVLGEPPNPQPIKFIPFEEAIKNFAWPKKREKHKYTPIESMAVDWDIDVAYIPRMEALILFKERKQLNLKILGF